MGGIPIVVPVTCFVFSCSSCGVISHKFMKKSRNISFSLFAFICLLFTSESFAAAKHVIHFGSNFGHYYSPENLQVLVGDTVQWIGGGGSEDFSKYDLDSVSFPDGAAPFPHITQGNTFNYVITAAGEYDYQSS